MKYILIFLVTITTCAAQKIQSEEMPAVDVLKYLNIDPNSVGFWKFQITFPTAKFGALEFKEITSGKKDLAIKDVISVGPAKIFEIEMFLSPFSMIESKSYRCIYYKISDNATTGISSLGAAASFQIRDNWKAEWGQKIPVVFKSSSGDTVDTVSFISSDTPIAKEPTKSVGNKKIGG